MRWLRSKGGFLVFGLVVGEKACVDFLRREIKVTRQKGLPYHWMRKPFAVRLHDGQALLTLRLTVMVAFGFP